MGDEYQFEQRAEFLNIIGKNKIVAASIGPSGEAILLTVPPEHEKAPFGRIEQSGGSFPTSRATHYYPTTFLRFDGNNLIQQVELAQIEVSFPMAQALPDGEVLSVGGRCEYCDGDPEKNATVFNADGEMLRQFTLGDGIECIQTTNDGKIWISYFDEGVMGSRSRWGNKPMGASGLNCFDANGCLEWEFKSPQGFGLIVDCYALNVAERSVWAYYYTEFPLVKIDNRQNVCGWRNEIRGANALAVHGKRVLLWGGYEEKHSRCVLQKFGGDKLVNSRELVIRLANGSNLKGARVIGRGSKLHAFVGASWFTFDLANVI
jgi:hypothetical protein